MTGEDVSKAIFRCFKVTLKLAVISMLVSLIIAIPLGIISALKKGTAIDDVCRFFALAGVSMPNFWQAYLLIIVFALTLKVLPSSGYGDGGIADILLPAITLGTGYAAVTMRLMRASMRLTKSICPECKRVIEASIFEENGKIIMGKECPDHGSFRDVYWSDAELYRKFEKYSYTGPGVSNFQSSSSLNCPFGCGICQGHEDSAETIKTANSLNVDVKMVTGDHLAIAKEIASQVGLGTNIVTADDFVEKSDSEAQEVVEKADGFAQVFPEHKYRIVELLQKKEHIVGMNSSFDQTDFRMIKTH